MSRERLWLVRHILEECIEQNLLENLVECRMSCERLWLVRHDLEECIEQNLLEYRTMSFEGW